MISIEFRDAKTHELLPIDPQTGWHQCEQFRLQNLYVSVAPGIVPHIKEGENFIRLNGRDTGHDYDLKQVGSIGRFAGKLQLYDGASGDHPLEPPLYINPRNIRKEDFEAIVRRLKQLAFMPNSPVVFGEKQRFSGQSSKDSSDIENENPDDYLKAEAQRFLKLCETVCEQWPLIERAPAQETCLTVQIIDASQSAKSLSVSGIQRVCQRPDARRLQALAVEETTRTVENSFLAFVLDEIKRDHEVFLDRLTSRFEELKAEWKTKPYRLEAPDHVADLEIWERQFRADADKWDAKQKKAIRFAGDIKKIRKNIEACQKQLANYRRMQLLNELVPALPQSPSARLTDSHEYGPIYATFTEYNNNRPKLFVRLKRGLDEALAQMSIHPTQQLYELWVLIEVFDTLVNRFSFLPANDDTPLHLLERFDVIDNDLVLAETYLAGRSFQLKFQCDGRSDIDASLSYVKKVNVENGGYLEPDIRIEFSTKDKKGETDKFSFVIDPKYRRYDDMKNSYMKERAAAKVTSMYEFDLIHTAKTKYKEKLESSV